MCLVSSSNDIINEYTHLRVALSFHYQQRAITLCFKEYLGILVYLVGH